MPVLGDIVDRDVVSLTPEMLVADAARLFKRYRIDIAPVMQHGRVLGLISMAALQPLLGHLASRVGDMPYDGYHALPPETTLDHALLYVRSERTEHLLVLDQGRLVGVVATARLVSSLSPSSNGHQEA